MTLGDKLGYDANQNDDTQSQIGNEDGEGTPIYEIFTQSITVYNTRERTYLGSPIIAFILGHPVFGVLGSIDGENRNPGSNTLGDTSTNMTLFQVSNHNNLFEEEFNNVRFQDVGSTNGTWDTSLRRLIF